MEKINELYFKFETFFKANPKYVWLLLTIVFITFGIGNLLGKKWAISPKNREQKVYYSILGHKVFGRLVGIIFILVGIASLIMVFVNK